MSATNLPLKTSTTCPRCAVTVEVSLRAIGSEVEHGTVTFSPEYLGRHVCADLRAPTNTATPEPRLPDPGRKGERPS